MGAATALRNNVPAVAEWPMVSGTGDYLGRAAEFIARQPPTPGSDGVLETMQRLCGAAAEALSAVGVGMSVLTEAGVRGVTAASNAAGGRIEEVQFLLGEGPGVDAFGSRRPVLVPDLAAVALTRWPLYIPAVAALGVQAVFAFPLQVGAARLGVLNVFRTQPGRLLGPELGQALTFAEMAVTTLLDGQAAAAPGAAADGLAAGVERSTELFQAQGMVMVQLDLGATEALTRIRAHAFAENRPLNDVAGDIVARRLRLDPDRQGPS